VSEVLAQHSAELVDIVGDHPELRSKSRELLQEAARVAQEGARFDGELISYANRPLARAEVLVPELDVRDSWRDADSPRVASRAHAC
jgi:hypothetical protein